MLCIGARACQSDGLVSQSYAWIERGLTARQNLGMWWQDWLPQMLARSTVVLVTRSGERRLADKDVTVGGWVLHSKIRKGVAVGLEVVEAVAFGGLDI